MGGVDWWYHNRGHYDLQMMREFSRDMPVLYVNSIGMRVPSAREGRMFFSRVARKLKSVRRGLVPIRENFMVLSVLAAPGVLGRSVQRVLMPRQIRSAARRMGIHRPLLWIACPPGACMIEQLTPSAIVYQRTDRFEAFPGVDRTEIERVDRSLREKADIVLYCNRGLFEDEADSCMGALLVDHGVDFERFAAAGIDPSEPEDIASIPRPRVGFVGSIDAHTFSPELFRRVVKSLPDVQFVLVGGCSLPKDWCESSNVHLLGQKAYEDVANYMAACDALIMPWNDSPWIKACNPVKLKEYMAVGRPIVSVPFDELEHWRGAVRIASDPASFALAIEAALQEPCDAAALRGRVADQTWHGKADAVRNALSDLGIDSARKG